MAPEVLRGQPYGFAADVWSLGCVLFGLLSGTMPFQPCEDDPEEEERQVLRGALSFEARSWQDVSDDAVVVVRAMLTLDPAARATATELTHKRWLTRATQKQAALQASLEGMKGVQPAEAGRARASTTVGQLPDRSPDALRASVLAPASREGGLRGAPSPKQPPGIRRANTLAGISGVRSTCVSEAASESRARAISNEEGAEPNAEGLELLRRLSRAASRGAPPG